MTLGYAIDQMNRLIKSACDEADLWMVKMSDDEACLSVYTPAGDIQTIRDATFLPAIELLNTVETLQCSVSTVRSLRARRH